ncbi:MAG: Na(+)-translocating NADH-quinone reductase subunit B [Gemmatimonadota bacterium]|nr:MAG: Na(+)-translocating NADH-quinone reductase subunit B [Gemmatimonadota bacterium]
MRLDFEETRDLWKKFEALRPHFQKGGKFEKLYPLFEAKETFLFVPPHTAKGRVHVRDAMDIKRLMSTVVVALIPCILWGMWNVGYQKLLAQGDPTPLLACLGHGAWHMLPIILVSYLVGGICEVTFAIVRKHEINEGFLVTGMLFPLVCPPTLPLWMVAGGIAFGTIIGKEVFGGTGMNILNPALTARAFVFFAYPAHMSGDAVWSAAGPDAVTGATPLAVAAAAHGPGVVTALGAQGITYRDSFLGLIPGSMGEVSALACLIGALILVGTGVGAWRIMISMIAGGLAGGFLMNASAGATSAGIMHLPPHWHLVLGGFAFGTVYMATDPVSAAATHTGKLIYGFLTGVLAVLIRAVNPAYPEGVMLAILFMNVFAPLIDHFVVQSNVKRRLARV